jgi:hypothetical protein
MGHNLYVENGQFACASTDAEWHHNETGHVIVRSADIEGMKQGALMDRMSRFVECAPLHGVKIDGSMAYIDRSAIIETIGDNIIVHGLRSSGPFAVIQPSGVVDIGVDIADQLTNLKGIDAHVISACRIGATGTDCVVSVSLGDLDFGAGDVGKQVLSMVVELTGKVDIMASTMRVICANTQRMARDQADKSGRRILADLDNAHGGLTDAKLGAMSEAVKLAVSGVIDWSKSEAERLQALKMIPFDIRTDGNLEKVLAHGIKHGIFGNKAKTQDSALRLGGPAKRGRKALNQAPEKVILTDDLIEMLETGKESGAKIYQGDFGSNALSWIAAIEETRNEETRYGIADMADTLACLDQAGTRWASRLGDAIRPKADLATWNRKLVTDMQASLTPRVSVTV